jgi:signal transduction histidine kinase
VNTIKRFLATASREEHRPMLSLSNQFGYESVALVPINVGDRIFGLLHLADSDEYKVPLYLVQAMETIMTALGSAIQRVRMEDLMGSYLAKLEQSNRALHDFTAMASHDMREPLWKIMAFGDQLKTNCGDQLGEIGNYYLERMQNAAKRMQNLITALLDYSRLTTSIEPFQRVDLAKLTREVLDDLEWLLHQTGGTVEIRDLPQVEADPHQMRQLLQNLIGNALKFHGEARPVIHITGRPLDGNQLQIIVEDNGIGFDKKHVERIFAPFHRLHGRGEYEGTGMGLAICKRIIERHGGSITARSAPGEGAAFIITLPLKQR